MAEKEKYQLSDIELDEISLVDVPANQKAKVLLVKRKKPDECMMKKPGGGCMDDDVEKAPAGVKFVIGFKEEGGSDVQSIIFDSAKWDADKAKTWLKDHGFTGSKVDETANTLRFRQQDPAGYTRFRVIVPGAQASKVLRASDSLKELQETVEETLRAKYASSCTGMQPCKGPVWIRDFYLDNVIFDYDGQTYRSDYEVARDANGELSCTLGEAVPVEVVYQDVKKADAVPDEIALRLLDLCTNMISSSVLLDKFNSSHDQQGRFSSKPTAGGGSGTPTGSFLGSSMRGGWAQEPSRDGWKWSHPQHGVLQTVDRLSENKVQIKLEGKLIYGGTIRQSAQLLNDKFGIQTPRPWRSAMADQDARQQLLQGPTVAGRP